MEKRKPRLLLVGDLCCHSGFARVNEAIAERLALLGWDIGVLAVNYKGLPHSLQQRYRLYPAFLGGEPYGVECIAAVAKAERPDVVLIVNDPWICERYLARLGDDAPPCVLYMPVDGQHLKRAYVEPLNKAAHVVGYTQFGIGELQAAGLTAPHSIIPHGIDLETFYPVRQRDARALSGLEQDAYAVLVLDRNAPRKRLDLAFCAFAQFAHDKPANVKLIYHGALDDVGWDIEDMAGDLGIADRLVLTGRDFTAGNGVAIEQLRVMYSMCDVRLSTSMGEGWGLPTLEAMACGLPNIVPEYAALGEWTDGAAQYIPISHLQRHTGGINTVGGVVSVQDAATALEDLYQHPWRRSELSAMGLELARNDRFRWETIADQFDATLTSVALAERVV
jgi:D-inositol-3-phosphate glycosyltransferase